MTSWKTYKLGGICDYVTSRTTNIENYISTENMLPNKGGVCTPSNVPSGAAIEYKVGDILISNIRPYFHKIWQADCDGACSADVLCIRANNKADNKFLYYLLSQQLFFDYVMSGAKGCKMPRGDKKQIMQWQISLPGLEEQRRIAGILGAIDDKIENNRRINTNLEQQAQALYKQWFVDFNFPNEDGKPYKSSGGKMVDSELGLIPEGWRVGNIGGYCKIRSGYAFKSSWWTDRGVKIIKIKNITENGVLDMSECSYVDIKHCDKASDFNGHAGDLIIAMTGATLGKVCIIPYHTTDYYINQRVGKFFLGDNPINKLPFIHCILRDENVMSEIINKGQGSAQPNISASDVETIKIVMPSYYIMDKFNLLLQSNYALWLKNMAEVNSFATLRDTLLPKLMNGEIKL